MLFAAFGIVSVLVLAWVIFTSGQPSDGPEIIEHYASPQEELEFYLHERMNYRLPFVRLLAERRIARAHAIAEQYPECAALARMVADSIQARLQRTDTTENAHGHRGTRPAE
ncbi:MAG: hypothetical protein QHI48_00435 [Bacteroidota bacterium]|nr:hypothetical protein [Bacteroidota bacterium]